MSEDLTTAEVVYDGLLGICANSREANFLQYLRRHLADPVNEQDEKGGYRASRLLLWLGTIGAGMITIFLYFTYQ